jgi:Ca2+-transporting ATPase
LITEAASLLDTDVGQRLSAKEAKKRLARYGPNKLCKGKPFSALVIFENQYNSLVG